MNDQAGDEPIVGPPRGADHYRRQMETVANNATLALFIMDERQHCTYMNPAAERLTGYTLAELEGKPLHYYIHHTRPDGSPYPLEECAIDQAFPQRMREQGEEVFVHRDGHFYPVAFTASPILDGDRPVGTIIEVQDISALKAREAERERLLAERERLIGNLDVTNRELESTIVELSRQAEDARRARSEANAARALSDAFFEAAPIAAGIVDPDLRYRRINRSLAEIDGVEPDEVVGRSIHEVLPHLAERLEPLYRQVLETGEPLKNVEVSGPRPTEPGSIGHYLVNYFPVISEDEVLGVGLLGLDVTAQRRAEEERQQEAAIVDALQRIGQSIAGELDVERIVQSIAGELDVERIVQEVTDTSTKLTGASFGAFFYNVVSERDEAYTLYTISGVPREKFSGFPMPRNTPIFAPTFHGTGVVRSEDITQDPLYGQMEPHHGMPEGHLPVRSYLAVPVMSRSGEVLGGLFYGHPETGVFEEKDERLAVGIAAWAGLAMDNARLYRSEHHARSEAERANKVKSEFLATMSHELRTPLNAMIGYSDLLLAGVPDPLPGGAQQKVERICVSAGHLLSLIEEILTFSRVEAGEEKLQSEMVDPGELLREVEALMEPLAIAKRIGFRCAVPEDPVSFPTDVRKLRQILINLIGNGIKFTDAGEVRVTLTEVGGQALFRVSDTGVGIAPDHLERIFEPFWQVEVGSTRVAQGTGLGLSVSRRLARLLGGEVEVESTVGQGSVFTVSIPTMPPRSIESP